jgi:hypothetical protein
MSHGARSLYIALKRRYWPNKKNNGRIYLSHRQARKELGRSSPNEIVRWFRELQYYGFIVMVAPGCLGVNGKGKAPRWRLTEVSYMRGTSSRGVEDMPTMDFLKWNGVRFSTMWGGAGGRFRNERQAAKENRPRRLKPDRATQGAILRRRPNRSSARRSARSSKKYGSQSRQTRD